MQKSKRHVIRAAPLLLGCLALVASCESSSPRTEILYFAVTAMGDGHVTIEPEGPQSVLHGDRQVFIPVPSEGFRLISKVGGTCPAGSWDEGHYATGPIVADCSVQFSTEQARHTVIATREKELTASPDTAQSVVHGATQVFALSAAAGYRVVTAVQGSCPVGSWSGSTYETGAILESCSVHFAAEKISHVVSAEGSEELVIAPTILSVEHGRRATFEISTAETAVGVELSPEVGGTCPVGSWSGASYTTGTVESDCTLLFSVQPKQLTVTPAGNGHVLINPVGATLVKFGKPASFEVEPTEGYGLASSIGGTCPAGTWSGAVYTTGPVESDCTVLFGSEPLLLFHTVTSLADENLTLLPFEAQRINEGDVQSFDVSVAVGYQIDSEVGGTCPAGEWDGSRYSTGAIFEDCQVIFSSARILYTVSVFGDTHLSLLPEEPAQIGQGDVATFTVSAMAGYRVMAAVGGTCPPGAWNAESYSTGVIIEPCEVEFSSEAVFMELAAFPALSTVYSFSLAVDSTGTPHLGLMFGDAAYREVVQSALADLGGGVYDGANTYVTFRMGAGSWTAYEGRGTPQYYKFSELALANGASYYTTNYGSFGGLIAVIRNGGKGTYAQTGISSARKAHSIAVPAGSAYLFSLMAQSNSTGLTLALFPIERFGATYPNYWVDLVKLEATTGDISSPQLLVAGERLAALYLQGTKAVLRATAIPTVFTAASIALVDVPIIGQCDDASLAKIAWDGSALYLACVDSAGALSISRASSLADLSAVIFGPIAHSVSGTVDALDLDASATGVSLAVRQGASVRVYESLAATQPAFERELAGAIDLARSDKGLVLSICEMDGDKVLRTFATRRDE